MPNILIVHASDYGSTTKMAEALAEGVRDAGGTPVLVNAEEATADHFTAADGIVFGSPVHMGSPDWRIKKLIDTVCSGLWMKDALSGKVGAVFATGSNFGGAGGGAELTLLSLLNNVAELGMLIVPLPKHTPGYREGGLQWGAYSQAHDKDMKPVGLREDQLVAVRHHGANITRVAALTAGKLNFSK
jgi:NAD(P)H dehydrogenase (quinone)